MIYRTRQYISHIANDLLLLASLAKYQLKDYSYLTWTPIKNISSEASLSEIRSRIRERGVESGSGQAPNAIRLYRDKGIAEMTTSSGNR